MTKTLNEQVRLPPPAPAGTDPIADDGAPYHSSLLLDMPRALNNLGTYCEPSFQFAFSSAQNMPAGTPSTWWTRAITAIPAAGQAFIAQLPIIVPDQATRLLWTLNLDRGNFNLFEGAPSIQVSAITLYLSPNPLNQLDPATSSIYPALSSERVGNFFDSNMPAKFAKHSLAVSFTSTASIPTRDFADDTATGWTDFAKDPTVYMVSQSMVGAPVAWLIVAASYNSAAQFDYIRAKEFSIWGQYE
jgi:hypothetical protein